MSDNGCLVLENIFWGAAALALFFFAGDGWWKLTAIVPLVFINTKFFSSK